MSLAVDEPIVNNPFEESKEYWVYEKGHSQEDVWKTSCGILLEEAGKI